MVRKVAKHDSGVCLPEDIVFEVLSRVPAKALCRFRCVCKGWRGLISDSAFVAAQRSHSGPHLVGVFFGASRWPPEVRVMDMDGNVVKVLELLLLRKDDGNDVLGVLQQQATTRLNVIVPRNQPIGATAMIIDPAAGRACTIDTYTHEIMSSFGHATPSGALKVLFLIPSQICKVATIIDGSTEPLRWRQRSTPPFFTSCGNPLRKATVNGVIYFLPPPHLNESDAASSSAHRIAAFDLESEEWKVINGPALAFQEETWYFTLTEHKGTLGLAQFLRERNDENHCAVIWLLIDINKSVWVKEYTIQMPRTWGLTKLLGAMDDGRVLLLVRELEEVTKQDRTTYHPRDVIAFYNPSTKTFTKFMDIAMGSSGILLLYTGSLLS